MRVDYVPGALLTVLHESAAAFDGTDPERATVALGGLTLKAAQPGADLNGYVVQTLATGQAYLRTPTGVQLAAITASALTWTAMAARINSDVVFSQFVRASVTTPGALSAVTATLAGGVNPTLTAGAARFKYVAVANAGLFFFDQKTALDIFSIQGNFPGGSGDACTVELVNLDDGGQPIDTEASTLVSVTLPASEDFTVVDVVRLQKYQAIRVTCANAGKVWVAFRQAPSSP